MYNIHQHILLKLIKAGLSEGKDRNQQSENERLEDCIVGDIEDIWKVDGFHTRMYTHTGEGAYEGQRDWKWQN